MRPRAILFAAAFAPFCLAPALAQTAAPADPGTVQDDCRAAPVQPGEAQTQQAPDDLTATLDDCNGVLAPPPTGDAEITEPAPDSGETPVVPPGALPEQPPAAADTPT